MDHDTAITNYTFEKYMLGELSAPDRDQFEAHFFSCPECAEHVRSFSQFSSSMVPALAHIAPAKVVPATEKKQSWLDGFRIWLCSPAYAGLSMAALVVMTSVSGYQAVALRNQNAPQAIVSFAMHPQARGDETVITVPKLGPFLLLEADVPIASDELRWVIRAVNSSSVLMEGTAAAPDAGGSLKLLLPASRLNPGEYILVIRSNKMTGITTPTEEASYRVKIGNY